MNSMFQIDQEALDVYQDAFKALIATAQSDGSITDLLPQLPPRRQRQVRELGILPYTYKASGDSWRISLKVMDVFGISTALVLAWLQNSNLTKYVGKDNPSGYSDDDRNPPNGPIKLFFGNFKGLYLGDRTITRSIDTLVKAKLIFRAPSHRGILLVNIKEFRWDGANVEGLLLPLPKVVSTGITKEDKMLLMTRAEARMNNPDYGFFYRDAELVIIHLPYNTTTTVPWHKVYSLDLSSLVANSTAVPRTTNEDKLARAQHRLVIAGGSNTYHLYAKPEGMVVQPYERYPERLPGTLVSWDIVDAWEPAELIPGAVATIGWEPPF